MVRLHGRSPRAHVPLPRPHIRLWAQHYVVTTIVLFVLILTVTVGNFIPGIPNMMAPLLVGWACAAGLSVPMTVVYGLLVFNAAFFGSLIAYSLGRNTAYISELQLDTSTRFQGIKQRVENRELWSGLIFKSRVGKFAAYCGHVNIAAGEVNFYLLGFIKEAAAGHFLWTLQYLAIGFAISWLMPYVGNLFR
jgi:hypothetical protein